MSRPRTDPLAARAGHRHAHRGHCLSHMGKGRRHMGGGAAWPR